MNLINSLNQQGIEGKKNNTMVPNLLYKILTKRVDNLGEKKLGFLYDIDNYIQENLIKGRTKEQLQKILQRIFTKLSLSAIIAKNGNTLKATNLDNKISIFLLKKYGFKIKDIWYNKSLNSIKPGYFNLGQGKLEGLNIRGFETSGLKSFFQNSTIGLNDKEISNSYLIYKILETLGFIEESDKENIKKLVIFSHFLSKGKFDFLRGEKQYLHTYHKTFYGIAPFLSPEFIYDYISKGNTGFELLNDDFLENNNIKDFRGITTYLSYFSDNKKQQIQTALDIIKTKEEKRQLLRYQNQKISFIVDLGGEIPAALDILPMLNYGLFKVNKNGDILIYNPSGFPGKMEFLGKDKNDKIVIISKEDNLYYKKVEEFLLLVSGQFTKKHILNFIGYNGEKLQEIKKLKTKQQKEQEKSKERKIRKKRKNKLSRGKKFEKQNYKLEDLKK